jgi:hypothetical protein
MIYTLLKAQLGNQLFIIFNTISLAKKYDVEYKIICNKNEKTLFEEKKTYFNSFLENIKDNIIFIDKNEYEELKKDLILIEEKEYSYNEIIIDKDKNYLLEGFYQSYKYFEDNFDHITKLIGLENKQKSIKNTYNYIYQKKNIAIHFRIGDYFYLQNLHPILTIKYYYNAINYIINYLKNNNDNILNYNILFFCNECDNSIVNKYISRLNMIYDNKLNFIKINDSIEEWQQMLSISLCDIIIIANSTFSWFGAYFSKNKKLVCYPETWFGKFYENNSIKDLNPQDWVSINQN